MLLELSAENIVHAKIVQIAIKTTKWTFKFMTERKRKILNMHKCPKEWVSNLLFLNEIDW